MSRVFVFVTLMLLLPLLGACTMTSEREPKIIQSPATMCCGYVGNDWEDHGVVWMSGHALAAACACPAGQYAMRVAISSSGHLVSTEIVSGTGDDASDRCVADAFANAARTYLGYRPGGYAWAPTTSSIDENAVRALWFPAPACADAARYSSLPDTLHSWRVDRRLDVDSDPCRRPVQPVIAEVFFDLTKH